MGLSQIFKVAARLMRWKNPFQKGAQEASDQYVGKKSKLTTFEDMTYATDLKELAEADRASVAQFRAKKMGIKPASGGENKDSWVCDDMTINAGSSMPSVLLALIAGGAAVWCFSNKVTPAPQPAPPAAASPVDSEYEVLFYDKDGNQIQVPRMPAGGAS